MNDRIFSERLKSEAMEELRAELETFSHDGLIALHEALEQGIVVRGSWNGCVISYKNGAAGSVRRDRLGRARNAFTVLWDNGWITDEQVKQEVEKELERRQIPQPAPALSAGIRLDN